MARGLCVLIGCASVAVAPVTAKASELEAPVGEAASGEAGATGATSESASAAPVMVTTTTRSPAVEVFTARKVRHDWYVGAGLGLGAGNFQASGASAAVMGVIRSGGRLTDKVVMGGALVSSLGGTNRGGGSGFTNLLVEALFFPVKGRGLGIAVGLGISSTWLRAPAMDGTVSDRKTQTGAGFGLGLGYDFWLARRFNLGLWLRGDGSGGRFGLRASGTLGLMLSWY